MDTKELIGSRIKELRKKKGLSQEQLSEKADITPNYLSRIERGTENPTLDMLIRLAAALDVEMWEIFDCRHRGSLKDLRSVLNKISVDADDNQLMLAVKILRAVMR